MVGGVSWSALPFYSSRWREKLTAKAVQAADKQLRGSGAGDSHRGQSSQIGKAAQLVNWSKQSEPGFRVSCVCQTKDTIDSNNIKHASGYTMRRGGVDHKPTNTIFWIVSH